MFLYNRFYFQNKSDFVATAKAIAANAKTISKFATVVAQKCPDSRLPL